MRTTVILSLILAASACAPDNSGPDAGVAQTFAPGQFRSGSRLRGRYSEAAGGSRVLMEFQDTLVNTACTFMTADDGVQRCLPTVPLTVMFADPQCQEPVAVADILGCTSEPRFAAHTRWDGVGCEGTTTVSMFTVGAPRSVPRTLHVGSPARCVALAQHMLELAWDITPVTADNFVGANVVTTESSGLAVQELHAEDGARMWLSTLRDVKMDMECQRMAVLGREVCAPVSLASSSGFVDNACTQAGFYAQGTCGATAGLMATGSEEDGFYHLGGVAAGMFQSIDGSCTQTGFDGTFYAAGPKIPIESLVPLQRGAVAPGRPAMITDLREDGTPLWTNVELAFDERGAYCGPRLDVNGDMRCISGLPESPSHTRVFEDAACTVELVRLPRQEEPPPMGVRVEPRTACGIQRVTGTFTVGEEALVEQVYELTEAGVCQRSYFADFVRAFRVGAEGDVSELPLVVQRTE